MRWTYLDEAVSRGAIPQVRYGESAAALDLTNTHSELSDGAFPDAVICGIEACSVDCDGLHRGRKEVEEVAERDTEGEAVPELCYGVC